MRWDPSYWGEVKVGKGSRNVNFVDVLPADRKEKSLKRSPRGGCPLWLEEAVVTGCYGFLPTKKGTEAKTTEEKLYVSNE